LPSPPPARRFEDDGFPKGGLALEMNGRIVAGNLFVDVLARDSGKKEAERRLRLPRAIAG